LAHRTNDSHQIAQARLAAIVESSDDAIISKDLNGIITSWNRGAEAIFGYTADEMIGKSVTTLIPPDRIDEEPGILSRIRAGERIDHYETVRRRKDGGLITVSLTVSPIFDANGKVVGASKIARDITNVKEIERVRRHAERMRHIVEAQESERRRIARDLHDHVGQEMTALRLQLEAMRNKSQGSPDIERDIDRLSQIAERMDWDLGFLSWELRPTELEQLGIADALRSFLAEWSRQHGIEAQCECTLPKMTRLSDHLATNIYRIVQEALNNIAKHSEATHVGVRFRRRRDDGLELTIKDNGVGFDPLVVGASKYSGFGLVGMRERAALFGGSLKIDSRPDHGTRLDIEFPQQTFIFSDAARDPPPPAITPK